jgi:hypothetical protein
MPKKVTVPLTEQQVHLFHNLAQEIVQAYLTKDKILAALSITEEQYKEIAENPTFQRILRQAVSEWSSATNTTKRVRLKSQWAIEEGLPYMFQSMTDTNEPLSARVEAFKAISRIGQLDAHEAHSGSDRSFRIEINIGQGAPPITINSEVLQEPVDNLSQKSDFDADNEPNYSPGKFVSAPPAVFFES